MDLLSVNINIKRIIQSLFFLSVFLLLGCSDGSDDSVRREDLLSLANAVERADLAGCDVIDTDDMKSYCIGEVTATKSISEKINLCVDLQDDLTRSNCQNKISNIITSMKNPDIDMCDLLASNTQDDCRSGVALAKVADSGDSSDCASISDADLQLRCDTELVFYQAQIARDPDVCKKIKDEDIRSDCVDQYWIDTYIADAIQASDSSICDQLAVYEFTGSTLADDCRGLIDSGIDKVDLIESDDRETPAQASEDFLSTAVVIDQDFSKDMAWFDAAVADLDLRQCEKISDDDRRMNCIEVLIENSFLKNKTPRCDVLGETENRSYCDVQTRNLKIALDQASSSGDATLCESLPAGFSTMSGYSDGLREKCLKNIYGESVAEIAKLDQLSEAITTQLDEIACSEISNLSYRRSCIESIIIDEAIARQSSDICDIFISNTDQAHCRDSYDTALVITEAIDRRDISICDQLTDNTQAREYCRLQINSSQ